MKFHSANSTIYVIFLLIIPFLFNARKNTKLDFFERGQAQLEKGEWKNALNIWLKAKSGFDVDSEADPRIGFAFIDVVTDKNESKYFEVANQMYFWGLKDVNVSFYRDELQAELDRLKPLMNKEKRQELQNLLDLESELFPGALIEFWIKQDPYPSSSYNERLLEHWIRIQQARRKYTMVSTTPYGTDDRGLIYVRYGEPSEIKKRSVTINQVVDPVSGYSIELSNNISFQAEIWYYNNISREKNTSFVFGWPGNGGSYGLQPGILSLVPVAGNRIASYYDEQKMISEVTDQNHGNTVQGGGFENSRNDLFASPGYTRVSRKGAELMLKYTVLEEIGAIDPFYNDLYNSMTRDIIKAGYTGSDEKFTQTARTNLNSYDGRELSAALLRDRKIPTNLSKTKSEIEHFEIDWQFHRFMDSNFKTIYMMASAAVDFQPLVAYASLQRNSYQANEIFQLNTMHEYDESWDLVLEQPHLIPLNEAGNFGTAIYYFGEDVGEKNLVFTSQFLDNNPNSVETRLHKRLNTYIIASTGAQQLKFPEPLQLEGEQNVQMSDVLLAVPHEENDQLRVPFAPKLDRTFAEGDTMLVYFEVYNIPKGREFQVEYMIEGLDKKQRPRKIGRSIILNYQSSDAVTPNWFEVPLSDLNDYGSYRLSLQLKLNSQKVMSRPVEFYLK